MEDGAWLLQKSHIASRKDVWAMLQEQVFRIDVENEGVPASDIWLLAASSGPICGKLKIADRNH